MCVHWHIICAEAAYIYIRDEPCAHRRQHGAAFHDGGGRLSLHVFYSRTHTHRCAIATHSVTYFSVKSSRTSVSQFDCILREEQHRAEDQRLYGVCVCVCSTSICARISPKCTFVWWNNDPWHSTQRKNVTIHLYMNSCIWFWHYFDRPNRFSASWILTLVLHTMLMRSKLYMYSLLAE